MCLTPQRRANFLHIGTSKSGPSMVCFVHFDFKMCFGPDILTSNVLCATALAILLHIRTSKSGPGMVCLCILTSRIFKIFQNVFRATGACNFSFCIWPDGSAPAALASLLFDHPHPQINGKTNEKHSVLRLSEHFAHLYLLSSNSFSFSFSLILFSSLLFISPYCRNFDF